MAIISNDNQWVLCGFFSGQGSWPSGTPAGTYYSLPCSVTGALSSLHILVNMFQCFRAKVSRLTVALFCLQEGSFLQSSIEMDVTREISHHCRNTGEVHFLLPGNGEVAYIAELSFSFPFQFNSFKSLTGKSLLPLLDNFLTYSCCLTELVLPPVRSLGTQTEGPMICWTRLYFIYRYSICIYIVYLYILIFPISFSEIPLILCKLDQQPDVACVGIFWLLRVPPFTVCCFCLSTLYLLHTRVRRHGSELGGTPDPRSAREPLMWRVFLDTSFRLIN